MSIDITVVCLAPPDVEVASRLASFVLRPLDVDFEAELFVFEPAAGYHEFEGQHVVDLSARRHPPAYACALVVASSIAILYEGRLVDDVDFFPAIPPEAVLRRCIEESHESLRRLWDALRTGSAS